jgi:hypothetical protein
MNRVGCVPARTGQHYPLRTVPPVVTLRMVSIIAIMPSSVSPQRRLIATEPFRTLAAQR